MAEQKHWSRWPKRLKRAVFLHGTGWIDLFACTIAVPLPADEEPVLIFLGQTFEQVELKKRLAAKKAPDIFRFDSTRFIARLKKPDGIGEADSIFQVRFEVQVKSLFELAWSRTTHALAYKSSQIDWWALRLVASLKASVEQMDLLLSDFENAMKLLGQAPWYEVERKSEIQDLLLGLQPSIPTEAWPKDLSRFVDNCYSLIEKLQKVERRRTGDWELSIYSDVFHLIVDFIVTHTGDLFPRSISLFQIVFAVTTKVYNSKSGFQGWFPISEEMEMLFPHVKAIGNRFRF